jgi:hypothetical protein
MNPTFASLSATTMELADAQLADIDGGAFMILGLAWYWYVGAAAGGAALGLGVAYLT